MPGGTQIQLMLQLSWHPNACVCDPDILECNKNVTSTTMLLPAREIVTRKFWSTTEM